jgi:methyl-accepting chemotaxis protein
MLATITGRITAILLSFALLLAAGAVASHFVLSRQADDALVVNLAGRQRMLTQKMTKEAAELANLSREGSSTEVSNKRDQLQNTMRVFETTLFALKDGGSAPLNLEMTKMRSTQAASVPEIQKQLSTVAELWEPFKKSMATLAASNGSDSSALKSVMQTNMPLMAAMNGAVDSMQGDSEKKVDLLVLFQGLSLALGVLLAVGGVWVARATITKPLVDLAAAAHTMSTGNLNVDLNLEGAQEVRELSASFDRMRASMLATLGGGLSPAAVGDDDL